MKKTVLALFILALSLKAMAQSDTFPFQGGRDVMNQFFAENAQLPQEIKDKKLTGSVIFKFSADENGNIKKVVLYYADDIQLVQPLTDILKKSTHKWIIPNHEKEHDFLLPLAININPGSSGKNLGEKLYASYKNRNPVYAHDQIPLAEITLLPAINIGYNVE